MKYAQLIIGLLAGTALGGSVVASTGVGTQPANLDVESVKAIVRQVILEEPKLIIESVQKMQEDEVRKQQQSANEVLKDPEVRKQIFEDKNAAVAGNKDSKRVVVEFFDYNCGACKMMFKSIDEVLKKDKDIKVVFHEYPIFGPQSEENSKFGIAVWRLHPEKYFDFHSKVMTHEGRVDMAAIQAIAKELGMDVAKLEAEAKLPEVAAVLEENRKLGDKMNIRGTPTLVVGEEIIPHGVSAEELESRLNAPANLDSEKPSEEGKKPAEEAKEPTKAE